MYQPRVSLGPSLAFFRKETCGSPRLPARSNGQLAVQAAGMGQFTRDLAHRPPAMLPLSYFARRGLAPPGASLVRLAPGRLDVVGPIGLSGQGRPPPRGLAGRPAGLGRPPRATNQATSSGTGPGPPWPASAGIPASSPGGSARADGPRILAIWAPSGVTRSAMRPKRDKFFTLAGYIC